MTELQRPISLALWAVLLCACRETFGGYRRTRGGEDAQPSPASAPASAPATPPEAGEEGNMGMSPHWSRHPDISVTSFSESKNATLDNHDSENMTTPKLQKDTVQGNGVSSTNNNSNTRTTTVISGGPGRLRGRAGPGVDPEMAAMCAYRVVEGGVGGQLCFRHSQVGFRCHHRDCRTVRSPEGSLVANVLTNGSVLLQWEHEGPRGEVLGKTKENVAGYEQGKQKTVSRQPGVERQPGASGKLGGPSSGPQVRKGGFELSCWWNGSYTRFECAGVHLGSGCRDFLLSELHENVPYRMCLQPLTSTASPQGPAQRRDLGDCVEFTVSPSGMQDIVIAMTTVGGAICVMLVIICLLVAYITENIMSPTTQHSHSTYHMHSCH